MKLQCGTARSLLDRVMCERSGVALCHHASQESARKDDPTQLVDERCLAHTGSTTNFKLLQVAFVTSARSHKGSLDDMMVCIHTTLVHGFPCYLGSRQACLHRDRALH